MILGLGERETCFKMSKVRLFKDLEKKVQIEYKKNAFSMNHFCQNFHFFHWQLFSRIFFDGIKDRAP